MKGKKTKQILSILGTILIFIVAYFGARYITSESIRAVQVAAISKEDYIKIAVEAVKDRQLLPQELDEVTVWTDITGTSEALQYHYILHDIDENQVDLSMFKKNLIPTLCTSTETRRFLDKEIIMEYHYSVEDSSQVLVITVDRSDCVY